MKLIRRVPLEVAEQVPNLPRDEKVLAWARGPQRITGDPTIVVVTARALYAPGFADRVEWQQILRAGWEDPILEVVIVTGPTVKLVRIRLDKAGSVPQIVNERVTSSIVIQRHIELVGKSGASLVARRVPDSTDIRWEVIFDPGLDAADPELRAQADEQLGWLRESAGI